MSKLRYLPSAVLTAALLFAGTASAQTWYDAREAYQRDQIQDGRANGSLTRQEYRHLQNGMQRIERYETFAERDGRVSPRERATLDRMLDREGREIRRESHDGQRADGRWGGHDGWGRAGWGHDGRHDGWNRGGDHDRDGWNNGRHTGWTRGEHNGWDGNRPPGIERRDARQEQRIHNGVRDGSLTHGEAARLQQGQNRIDRAEARARSDGVVTRGERNGINGMQNRESRQIYNARHNERTAPATPTAPTTGTQRNTGSHNWGNGGWRTQQAAMQPAAPRPTMTRASSPAPNATGGGRNWGSRR